jgi:FkbM family methyltransferase
VGRLVDNTRRVLHQFGIDVVKYEPRSHAAARLAYLLERFKISMVLDVGANDGGFARLLRQIGWRGRILSIEPSAAAFARLERAAAGDANWECLRLALGEREEILMLNLAANSESSSILEMLPSHEIAAPGTKYIGTEHVSSTTIDALARQRHLLEERLFLKMDTQGYEERILAGARESLANVIGIMLEMSLVPLYKGERLFNETHAQLNREGFVLYSIEPVMFFSEATGQLMQVNGTYFRTSADPIPGEQRMR